MPSLNKYISVFYLITFFLLLFSCSKDSAVHHETIYIRNQGADMPAYIHGNRASESILIVVHGAGSFGLSFREGVFTEQLEKDHLVVYYDQRGHSHAQGNTVDEEGIIQLLADDIKILVDIIQALYGHEKSIFLMGHSMGGLLTSLAIQDDQLQSSLSGWINVSGVLNMASISVERKNLIMDIAEEQINDSKDVDKWNAVLEELNPLVAEGNEDYFEILETARDAVIILMDNGSIQQNSNTELLIQSIVSNNPIHWFFSTNYFRPIQEAIDNELNLIENMQDILVPSLFIYGKYDVSAPPNGGRLGFENMDQNEKEYHLFESSLHHPMYSEPELFGNTVETFIETYK